ncbi:hypothetical protein AB9Q10_37475 [Streptomyces krungchingensis]|uniref:hypothetical protein n=1 Tax=Streptomyces krungchingensis TaxID=1565034 RepID=UPI003CF38BBA
MTHFVPPQSPPPDDGDTPSIGSRPPGMRPGNGNRVPGSWLRSQRRGQGPTHLPLQLVEAFLIGHDSGGPTGGLLRFRTADADGPGRARPSWWRRPDLGHQLAGSRGELRLFRNDRSDATGTRPAPIAILTLNGITDAATLVRLNIGGTFLSITGKGAGRVADVDVDVRFSAGLWGLRLPEHTRCRVHLEGPARLISDWPMQR